jgi:hypothetical protein
MEEVPRIFHMVEDPSVESARGPHNWNIMEESWLNGSVPKCIVVALCSNPVSPQPAANPVSPEVGCHLGWYVRYRVLASDGRQRNSVSKVGIRNLSPHLRNSAILRTAKMIAELRTKKSCGTAIVDLQNLTSAIPQLSAVSCQFRYFLVPFPQLRMD